MDYLLLLRQSHRRNMDNLLLLRLSHRRNMDHLRSLLSMLSLLQLSAPKKTQQLQASCSCAQSVRPCLYGAARPQMRDGAHKSAAFCMDL